MYPHLDKDSRDKILVTEGEGKSFKFNDSRKKKVLIAYHAHCIDGFTSAWACWKGLLETTDVLSEDITLQAVEYGKLHEVANSGKFFDEIYFVDFSVPPEMLELLALDTWVCIIDHHKTAYEMYEGGCDIKNVTFIMDLSECGASLVWKYFFGDRKMPRLIEYVKDYDLWQFKLSSTKEVNKTLRVSDKTLEYWEELSHELESLESLRLVILSGEAIQAYHDSIVRDLVSQAEPCWIDEKEGLLVNCSPQFASDVGHELAVVSGTYGATWQQEGNGTVKWSLRSNGDYDVSAIASSFSGGGHKNAAGFTLAAPREDMGSLGVTLWSSK